jgi:selenide, water dikinase
MQGADPLPLVRDLVLVGGGHTHALVLKSWAMRPLAGARVTVINPDPTAPYTGMLPGHIAGHYERADLEIDLVKLARHAGARLILGRAVALDTGARRITVPGRPPLPYDVASIDIGITSDLPDLPGFTEHAVAAKPLGDFARRWAAFLPAAGPAPRLVVIGGGVAGVELALAMDHRLREGGATPRLAIIEADDPLSDLGEGARTSLLAHLARARISLIAGARVVEIRADAVTLDDGRVLASDFTLGAAGARPQEWLRQTALPLVDGFIEIGPRLLVTGHDELFAVGDCAHMDHAPRPKAGVFAVRQAPVLYHNLRAALSGGSMQIYRPQKDYLKLISTGGRGAVADKFGLKLDGGPLWLLKDRFDRRFMDGFASLPAPRPPALPRVHAKGLAEAVGDRPLCGGCAAKVGAGGLGPMLAALPRPARDDVLAGAGDDAAELACGDGVQVIANDHLRGFSEDPWLVAQVAAVHALGDVWAMGAAPQAMLASVILPRLSSRLQARWLEEIMTAAAGVAKAAGAEIVGGHTSLGAELTIGFTVTGLADRAVGKAGARPGDVLVLTKPLGSGVILAAEMACAAPGAVVVGAWQSMTHPLAEEAAILAPVAHAMTDVTGFGLAGHLAEMLRASGRGARLDLDAVPALHGALDLLEADQRATLYEANRAATVIEGLPASPRAALLFDPQTAGGLLAALPEARAGDTLERLHEAGVPAAIIGAITETPGITLR